jgi:hypothetical protein
VIGAAFIFAALLIVVGQEAGVTRLSVTLDPARISRTKDLGYVYKLDVAPPLPGMRLRADTPRRPSSSNLVLMENGVRFGLPHSQHELIASLGQGRYSHWQGYLYFSTADGTDPRANGRTYQAVASFAVPQWILLTLLAAGILAIGISAPSRVFQDIVPRRARDDLLPLVALVALAGLETWLLLASGGSPTIVESTDGGNISSWVAGRLYPDRLSSDFLLGDESNTSFYVSVLLTSVRLLAAVTDDIGRAYLWTYLPILALQLSGFYLLGHRVTGSRLWGAVLALSTNASIWIWGHNELFGSYFLPLTRTSYDAILPFLLLLFWSYGREASRLPLLFGLCGLTIYVHPVSAPTAAAGFWLASLAFWTDRESPYRRFGFMFAGAFIFILAALPFGLSFFSSFSGGLQTGKEEQAVATALEAFRKANGAIFYDAALAFVEFLRGTGQQVWPIWLIGLAGLTVVPLINRQRGRLCMFFLLFLAGCLLGSVGVCLLDQTVASTLGRSPFQLDLIRGLRLVVVPLLVGFVLALSELEKVLRQRWRPDIVNAAAISVAVLFVGKWWTEFPNRLGSLIGLAPMPAEARENEPDASDMMRYLRVRPVDGLILPIGTSTASLGVRYAGLQPLAFISNDVNALFYSGSAKRAEWYELNQLRLALNKPGTGAYNAFKQLATRSQARYALLETTAVDKMLGERILKSGRLVKQLGNWLLIDINSDGAPSGRNLNAARATEAQPSLDTKR